MRTLIAALLLLAPASVDAAGPAGSWNVDPERSSVRFTVTKFGREVVEGRFNVFAGSVHYDASRPERSSVRWNVRADSISTGHSGRDGVLRGPEFFDSGRFPSLTFVSHRVRPLPDGRIHVSGAITIRGVQRPLVITARPVAGGSAPAFESAFVLNRHDFGVSGGSVSRHGISDTVRVQLRLVGVRR